MEKVVNGQLVDVGDIRLFELGLEGLSINKVAINNISIEIAKTINIAAYNFSLSINWRIVIKIQFRYPTHWVGFALPVLLKHS